MNLLCLITLRPYMPLEPRYPQRYPCTRPGPHTGVLKMVVLIPSVASRLIRPTVGPQDQPRTSRGSKLTPSPLRGQSSSPCTPSISQQPLYSRANYYPWSPFPPRRARPGPGPHTAQGLLGRKVHHAVGAYSRPMPMRLQDHPTSSGGPMLEEPMYGIYPGWLCPHTSSPSTPTTQTFPNQRTSVLVHLNANHPQSCRDIWVSRTRNLRTHTGFGVRVLNFVAISRVVNPQKIF